MTTLQRPTHLNVPEIIAHLNEAHTYDLMTFALYGSHLHQRPPPVFVRLNDIYEEGLLFLVQDDLGQYESLIPFATPIGDKPWHQQYIELLSTAAKATNRHSVELIEDCLLVSRIQTIGNFYRITAELPKDTPPNWAGFAYLIKINHKDSRYYTLRSTWMVGEKMFGNIDVYTHNQTLGSRWVGQLKVGDALISTRRYPERTDHLTGQVLLIGDETALPTILRLLELNDFRHPLVIACIKDDVDLQYLETCTTPIIRLSYTLPVDLLPKILEVLDNRPKDSPPIDSMWAAMEASLAKRLRQTLKARLMLTKEQMAVKVYWRGDEKE